MTENQQQTREQTPDEQFRMLFDRTTKLNDAVSALLAPAWGSEIGIIPSGHPLYVGDEARTTPDNSVASGDAADNTLREQYAAAVECAIGLNVDCGGTEGVHRVRDAVLAVRDSEMERLEKLHQAHLRVEQRLAGESLVAAAVVERVRLHIAVHRQRLQYADPVLLGRLDAVLREVGELEAAGGGGAA